MTIIHQQAIQHHYDNILRDSYSWMFGDFDEKVDQYKILFDELQIAPNLNKIAIDIGAGSGFQTIPLLKRGFTVYAVDVSGLLLKELQDRANAEDLIACQQEALAFLHTFKLPFELLICMGDTLAHFHSHLSVSEFFGLTFNKLSADGTMILSFRSNAEVQSGHSLIIPVRIEAERSLSCIVDYYSDYLRITDVIREYQNGEWKTRRGTYYKLRLSPKWVENELKDIGFHSIQVKSIDDLIMITAKK